MLVGVVGYSQVLKVGVVGLSHDHAYGLMNQYKNGAVSVTGDSIVAVGSEDDLKKEYSAKEIIYCKGKVLMPGLVICPGHCGGSLAASFVAVPPASGITYSSVAGCMYIPCQ